MIKSSFIYLAYGLKLLLMGLVSFPAFIVVILLGPFDHQGRLAYQFTRWWSWAILKVGGIRLKVQGLDALELDRQYIFIANHQSFIDIPVLSRALIHFQLRWVAKKELLWIPFFGWALWSSRNIVIDRANFSKTMASLKKARAKVQAGNSVVIFPEGTRGADGQILPFKRGGFVLALKTRTPIVPVTINGSDVILPRGDWRIRKGEIEIVLNKPVLVEQYQKMSLRYLADHVYEIVVSHSRNRQCISGYEKNQSKSVNFRQTGREG